jgi:nuclear pore complex protein Nup205
LQILETALFCQSAFLDAARAANTSIVLTGLDRLLLGVNHRSGRPDHVLNVAKFVTYAWWLPEHALAAVRVLCVVAESPSAHAGLLATLNVTDAVGKTVIKGFTDVLDDDQGDDSGSIGLARIAIVELLLTGLDKPSPSLSHFLLGFDVRKGVAGSTLQPPGMAGAIRTPFHAILSFLRPGMGQPSTTMTTSPQLCETAFKLIYCLGANHQTSEPTLRYLRSTEDFLGTQLSLLPFSPDHPASSSSGLKGVSWLLKTVAIELKLVSTARMRSQVALLTALLLDASGRNPESANPNEDLTLIGAENTLSQLSRTTAGAPSATAARHNGKNHK